MQELLRALSWTFLHSLWQGLLAALMAAIIISATKKASARLRYNLLGTVLILFLAGTAITFDAQLQLQAESSPAVNLLTVSPGEIISSSAGTLTTVVENKTIAEELSAWFNNNTNILMIAWSVLFLLNCLKLFTGLATVQRMRHYKTYSVSEEWTTKLSELQLLLGIRQKVQLLHSGLVKIPVAIGFLRPVILVPVGMLANIPAEQAESILLHELSHIRRKDYLVNLIQRFADAIFFFNPGFTWVSSLLRQEREACCDDIAVAATGQKREYIDALVSFQEYSMKTTVPVMAIGNKKHYLLNRVKRILTKENKRLDLFEKLALLAGVIIFSAFTIIKGVKEKTEEAVTSTPVETEKLEPLSSTLSPLKPLPPMQSMARKEKKSSVAKKEYPASDTVPLKKDQPAQAIPGEEKKLNHFMTETREDKGMKWQTIKATDQYGAQYHLTRNTGQPIILTVDGKTIPDNELNNWSSVLDQLYKAADKKHNAKNERLPTEKEWQAASGQKGWVVSNNKGWENEEVKKKWESQKKDWENTKKMWEAADMKAKNDLKEIERIKDKMQVKKDAIGVNKEKLQAIESRKEKEKENIKEIEKEKQQINKKIEEQRADLHRDRDQLNKKRVDWERSKKEAADLKERTDKTMPVKKPATDGNDDGDGDGDGSSGGRKNVFDNNDRKKLFASNRSDLFDNKEVQLDKSQVTLANNKAIQFSVETKLNGSSALKTQTVKIGERKFELKSNPDIPPPPKQEPAPPVTPKTRVH